MKKRYIKRDRFDDDQRIAQYMTEYIANYENYDPDVEDLVDDMNVYTINFTLSAFKSFHSSAFIKPDNFAINYYHDDVVIDPKASDRYDYAYY